jgi:hypothetical protein
MTTTGRYLGNGFCKPRTNQSSSVVVVGFLFFFGIDARGDQREQPRQLLFTRKLLYKDTPSSSYLSLVVECQRLVFGPMGLVVFRLFIRTYSTCFRLGYSTSIFLENHQGYRMARLRCSKMKNKAAFMRTGRL